MLDKCYYRRSLSDTISLTILVRPAGFCRSRGDGFLVADSKARQENCWHVTSGLSTLGQMYIRCITNYTRPRERGHPPPVAPSVSH